MIKVFWSACIAVLLFGGCKNKDADASPYDELLLSQPYALWTDSILKDKSNPEFYYKRGLTLFTNNYPEPALADFSKAWSLQKMVKYAHAIALVLRDKNLDSAISFLESAVREIPDNDTLRSQLALAYYSKGDDKALKVLNEIVVEHPNNVEVLLSIAELSDRKGDKKRAIELYEKILQLTPDNPELINMLALKYAETKNPKVIALCDSLIKADSADEHAEPHYYKGIYYSNIGDKQKALASFNEAIQKDYNFLDGYIEKASVLYDMKRFPEAIKTLNLALTISPQFADAYYWLGKCQEAIGQKEDASLNYQKALGLDPSMKEAKDRIERLKK